MSAKGTHLDPINVSQDKLADRQHKFLLRPAMILITVTACAAFWGMIAQYIAG